MHTPTHLEPSPQGKKKKLLPALSSERVEAGALAGKPCPTLLQHEGVGGPDIDREREREQRERERHTEKGRKQQYLHMYIDIHIHSGRRKRERER